MKIFLKFLKKLNFLQYHGLMITRECSTHAILNNKEKLMDQKPHPMKITSYFIIGLERNKVKTSLLLNLLTNPNGECKFYFILSNVIFMSETHLFIVREELPIADVI